MVNILNTVVTTFVLTLVTISAYEFEGDLTFYGGAGSGGACSSSYVPEGFTTVAMNNEQYADGLACGSCLEAVYHTGTESIYFEAIVDNLCPECLKGDLDLGESGDGRWKLEWNYIDCPPHDLIITSQGSNPFYAKIKVEGSGNVNSVSLNGVETTGTPDGYWVVEDFTGSLGCGPKADIVLGNGVKKTVCLDPALFGGSCSGDGTKCSEPEAPEPEAPEPEAPEPEIPKEPKDEVPEEDVEVIIEAPSVGDAEDTKDTSSQPETSGCSEPFKQCGGKSYDGPECCEDPYECLVINEFYSQCKYVEDEGDTCQSKWKQCAGKEWTGETCCKRGFKCVLKNEWYSHCL